MITSQIRRLATIVLLVAGGVCIRRDLAVGGDTCPPAGPGVPPPLSQQAVDKINTQLDEQIAVLSRRIEQNPANVDLYSQRGDCLFFRRRFDEAVTDFDKMIELKPELEESHWRRGIAYFYAEQYGKAAHQFEIYHSFDNIDRENGIWRYLSQRRAHGRAKAREGLLKYEKDDREPFPDVYRMFAGERSAEEILKQIESARIPPAERDKRLFYTRLYAGLNDAVEDQPDSAEAHLREAVANQWGASAGGGPGWMWQVGRVQYDLLRAAREEKAKRN